MHFSIISPRPSKSLTNEKVGKRSPDRFLENRLRERPSNRKQNFVSVRLFSGPRRSFWTSGQETPRIAPPSELASLGGYASPLRCACKNRLGRPLAVFIPRGTRNLEALRAALRDALTTKLFIPFNHRSLGARQADEIAAQSRITVVEDLDAAMDLRRRKGGVLSLSLCDDTRIVRQGWDFVPRAEDASCREVHQPDALTLRRRKREAPTPAHQAPHRQCSLPSSSFLSPSHSIYQIPTRSRTTDDRSSFATSYGGQV